MVKNRKFLHENRRFWRFQKCFPPEIREISEPQSYLIWYMLGKNWLGFGPTRKVILNVELLFVVKNRAWARFGNAITSSFLWECICIWKKSDKDHHLQRVRSQEWEVAYRGLGQTSDFLNNPLKAGLRLYYRDTFCLALFIFLCCIPNYVVNLLCTFWKMYGKISQKLQCGDWSRGRQGQFLSIIFGLDCRPGY